MSLFDASPYEADPPPRLNAPKLVDRQAAKIAAGWHPLSGTAATGNLRLAPEGTGTCGTCKHRRPAGDYSYPKCAYGSRSEERSGYQGHRYTVEILPRAACSAQTDCRAWWPACTSYEPREASA